MASGPVSNAWEVYAAAGRALYATPEYVSVEAAFKAYHAALSALNATAENKAFIAARKAYVKIGGEADASGNGAEIRQGISADACLALRRMVWENSPPNTDFICLSDVKIPGVYTLPLLHKWPGFWAKMELFSPAMKDDFLFMDLDTVILGPIDDFLKPRPLTTFGGALMWLPEKDR